MLLHRGRLSLRLANTRLLSAVADYAVAPYRQIVGATAAQREQWAAADKLLHERMREHVPDALAHNGEESFDLHLVGVQSVLRSWSSPEHLTNAALYHSIYGTEGFQGFALPLSHREELAELIGERAERLAWIFCMVDRASVDESVFRWVGLSQVERDAIAAGADEPRREDDVLAAFSMGFDSRCAVDACLPMSCSAPCTCTVHTPSHQLQDTPSSHRS